MRGTPPNPIRGSPGLPTGRATARVRREACCVSRRRDFDDQLSGSMEFSIRTEYCGHPRGAEPNHIGRYVIVVRENEPAAIKVTFSMLRSWVKLHNNLNTDHRWYARKRRGRARATDASIAKQ